MNCIVKALIATLLCVAVLAGPTVATTIEISTCQDDGFGMIPLAPGEVIQEGIYANGPQKGKDVILQLAHASASMLSKAS